jgi:cytochrome c biogenesis protein
MLSVLMSYLSHSQIWALETEGKLYVGGRTNRAQVTFEREVVEILDKLAASKQQVEQSAIAPTSLANQN